MIALVAGCQAGGGGGEATRGAPLEGAVQIVERDVEAPEVFSVEERALWDGRPSLGGVWVASSSVRDPERVIIRDPETGKTVIGALFKREREIGGPPLQLSSDAATALGLLAGAPKVLEVVALRRESVSEPAPDMPISNGEVEDLLAETPEEDGTEVASGEATDAIAVASAAVADLETSAEISDAAPAVALEGAEDDMADIEAAPEEEPKRRNVFSRIFGPRQTPEATDLAEAGSDVIAPEVANAPPAELPTPAAAEVVATLAETGTSVAAPVAAAAAAPVGALTDTDVAPEFGAAPDDAIAATEDAAPRKGFLRRLFGPRNPDVSRTDAEPDALPIDAAAEAPIAASAAAPTIEATSLDATPIESAPVQVASAAPLDRSVRGLDENWVQIGVFNEEARARAAAGDLRAAGVVGTIRQETVRGQTIWRLVVGPMDRSRDRQAIIRKAQDIGYTDAFAIDS